MMKSITALCFAIVVAAAGYFGHILSIPTFASKGLLVMGGLLFAAAVLWVPFSHYEAMKQNYEKEIESMRTKAADQDALGRWLHALNQRIKEVKAIAAVDYSPEMHAAESKKSRDLVYQVTEEIRRLYGLNESVPFSDSEPKPRRILSPLESGLWKEINALSGHLDYLERHRTILRDILCRKRDSAL